jgi:hypothetical protein
MIPLVPKSSGPRAGRALAFLPCALLIAYGVAFAAAALGTRPPAYDDHPGQLHRLWQVVTLGAAPWTWNEGWWTGYPELQFYPPAFAWAGALLHALAFGTLSVPGAYVALVWLAYLAPGLATLVALAQVQRSPWLALPAAFLALTLSLWPALMSGVEGGVHVGMAPARLAWALLALLLAALLAWSERTAGFPARAVVPLVALIVLTHPAHLPAALVLVLLAALAAPPRPRRLATAAGWLAIAALVTAFWTLPLVVRLGETRALAWGELSLGALGETLGRHPLAIALLPLALWALVRARAARSAGARLVAVFPWAMVVVVALDAALLEPRGIRWLPADRVMDAFWLALVMAAGLGWSGIHGLRPHLDWPRWSPRWRDPLVGVAGILLSVLASLGSDTLALWPRPTEWPSLEATARGLRLPALWSALRAAPPGRVLFVRSSVPLVYGPEWWKHTHVTALVPEQTGRAIVNGTFTHPSPTAALVYRGRAGPGAITQLVERLDGISLFGRPLASLDAATLNHYARRLGISAIVALEDDLPRLAALADNPVFRTQRSEPPFVVWLGPPAPLPQPQEPGRWRVALDPAAGGWTPAGLAYYPLWRASVDGRALETRRGVLGELEVRLDGPAAVVELAYGPGGVELAGGALSAVTILLAGAWLLTRRTGEAGPPTR